MAFHPPNNFLHPMNHLNAYIQPRVARTQGKQARQFIGVGRKGRARGGGVRAWGQPLFFEPLSSKKKGGSKRAGFNCTHPYTNPLLHTYRRMRGKEMKEVYMPTASNSNGRLHYCLANTALLNGWHTGVPFWKFNLYYRARM